MVFILKINIPGEDQRVFITSLTDNEKYLYQEIVDMYYERWEIEEQYKKNKELFKVEKFHAQTENGVLQEIYAQLLLSNITRLMINETEEDNKDAEDVPSFKNALIVVERYLNKMMYCNNLTELQILFQKMKKEISLVRYKKIQGRSFPRKSFSFGTKWYMKKCA